MLVNKAKEGRPRFNPFRIPKAEPVTIVWTQVQPIDPIDKVEPIVPWLNLAALPKQYAPIVREEVKENIAEIANAETVRLLRHSKLDAESKCDSWVGDLPTFGKPYLMEKIEVRPDRSHPLVPKLNFALLPKWQEPNTLEN